MPRQLSKNDRVLVLIALMAAASFVVGGAVSVITSADLATLETAKAQFSVALGVTDALTRSIREQQSALDDYVFSHSAAAHDRYNEAQGEGRRLIAQIDGATNDMPEVRSGLEILAAANLDWEGRIAIPAVIAVRLGDPAALAQYASDAGDDHSSVDAAIDLADAAIARVGADIARRHSSADSTASIGAAGAFAFLALAFGTAMVVVRRFGSALERDARQASVLNSFTEVTSFSDDDQTVARANLVALARIAKPDASVTHILNRSMDRAVPEAATGDAIAEILPLRALDRCAGVLRGTMFVADDLSDELSVHCPIYPATSGTLVCVPLDSGETVGAVHLYWRRARGLPLDRRASIGRVAEHAALSIGNRRLLAALHGQANTDPRTGLANSRSFDLALEGALARRAGHEPLSVLMLDLDHFKDFNDRQGHPAGDEALKAFAAVLRSCMRDDDVAARYGGEEFAVLLPGVDAQTAFTVAERIRARTEATIIPLAPGITDHITVSVGISSAPEQALDRVSLMRVADQALYRAKDEGRNRVVGGLEEAPPPWLAA